MESQIVELLSNQISDLKAQITSLNSDNKELQNKIFDLLQNKPTQQTLGDTKPEVSKHANYLANELINLKQGNNCWDKLISNEHVNLLELNDIKFCELGYTECVTEIIVKVLKSTPTRLINTIDKKNRIVAVYRDEQWIKLCFIDFVKDIKKLANKVVIGLLRKYYSRKLIADEQHVIMMDETDKYKEAIAKQVLEYCVII